MKYRAVAVGVEQSGHPVQVFGNDLVQVARAAAVLAVKYACKVQIWKTVEELDSVVQPGKVGNK